jgi:transcriptional regulator with XRE-family HTH domain
VRLARQAKRWPAAELAARAGVSARTVSMIERGSPTVSAGNLFNVAVLAGVDLFGADADELARLRALGRDKIALIPARTYHLRPREDDVDLDF